WGRGVPPARRATGTRRAAGVRGGGCARRVRPRARGLCRARRLAPRGAGGWRTREVNGGLDGRGGPRTFSAVDLERVPPGRPAVVAEGQTLTYGDLIARSEPVLARLVEAGFGMSSPARVVAFT